MSENVENKKRKVCIMGFAPSWTTAPWLDKEWEIWTLNEAYKLAEREPNFRADRWYEIHDRYSISKNTDEHIAFLKQCPCPVYMWQHYDDIPNSVRFPKEEILEHFASKGYKGSGYITNSISWFIAHAIYEGNISDLLIVGVDLSQDAEYGWQKPSCEYWIGLAEGLGINVTIAESSELLKSGVLYGYESNNKIRNWIKAQSKELGKRAQMARQNELQYHQAMTEAQIQQAEIRGAKSAYMEILKRGQ